MSSVTTSLTLIRVENEAESDVKAPLTSVFKANPLKSWSPILFRLRFEPMIVPLELMFPLAVMFPVNKCVSSDESPNCVEPDNCCVVIFVTMRIQCIVDK